MTHEQAIIIGALGAVCIFIGWLEHVTTKRNDQRRGARK